MCVCVSYHSPGENMVSEEFLKFMFGLVKKSRILVRHFLRFTSSIGTNGFGVERHRQCQEVKELTVFIFII